MAKTAREILEKVTNINNIKYNKDNKNINNTNIVPDGSNEVEEHFVSSLASPASQPLGEALASRGTLPPLWKGVKLDLFANPGHTLKITILRHDGTQQPLSSQMNSPRSYVFRGREQGQGSARHWELVEYLMELRKGTDYKISKVSLPKKGGTIDDFVAMIHLQNNVWTVDLIKDLKIWTYTLDKTLSAAFVKKNGIASGYVGITGHSKPWIKAQELGI